MQNRWPAMRTDVIRSGLSRRGLLGAAVLLPAVVAVSVRSGHTQAAGSSRGNRHQTHVIRVDRMVFAPAPSNIRVGDTVTWTNLDVVRHTATARNGAFNVDLPAGASASATMGKAGRFDYFCRYHPAMQSQIMVVT